jgi:hypothetical protein
MKIFSFLLFTFVSFSSLSQNIHNNIGDGIIYLKPMSSASPSNLKKGSYVGPHLLGDSITYLLNNFEKQYVYYKTSSGAYPTEEKVILKTNIYKKVHEFDNFITKSYTYNLDTKKEAIARLTKVISIGVKLLYYDTRQLEKEVKKLKLPTDFERYLNELQFK